MARFAGILISLSLFCVGSGRWVWNPLSMPKAVTKAVKDTVWLGPEKHLDFSIYKIDWYFSETHIAGSFLDNHKESPFYEDHIHPSYRDRVRLHHTNLTLEIRELGLHDTGSYLLIVEYLQYLEWSEDRYTEKGATFLHVLERGQYEGEDKKGLTTGAIAGIVCGVVFAVAVGLILLAIKFKTSCVMPRLEDWMKLSQLQPEASS